MSSIPSSAMPHARASHDDTPPRPAQAEKAAKGGDLRATADKMVSAVKEHPGTAVAIGAAVIGAAAAIALPLVGKGDAKKKPAKRAAKKG